MAARMHISWPRMGTCEHANTVHKYHRERERERDTHRGRVTETEYLNLDPTIFDIRVCLTFCIGLQYTHLKLPGCLSVLTFGLSSRKSLRIKRECTCIRKRLTKKRISEGKL